MSVNSIDTAGTLQFAPVLASVANFGKVTGGVGAVSVNNQTTVPIVTINGGIPATAGANATLVAGAGTNLTVAANTPAAGQIQIATVAAPSFTSQALTAATNQIAFGTIGSVTTLSVPATSTLHTVTLYDMAVPAGSSIMQSVVNSPTGALSGASVTMGTFAAQATRKYSFSSLVALSAVPASNTFTATLTAPTNTLTVSWMEVTTGAGATAIVSAAGSTTTTGLSVVTNATTVQFMRIVGEFTCAVTGSVVLTLTSAATVNVAAGSVTKLFDNGI